ncbi:SubName: Full=Uncharacterized protein {ECO:0000313/EMBL:CCA71054.1} [Serendipita indica DSM 11827]|uniref:DUF6533 domain-containing protein n=1 Tax=Serendipita indica (strain DSM 11827) TaxID=1109443 RepID=G4TIA7_SERID|nr:SubName: Full=Uncharacterized protein {ECO:0000313/EMBL:CCA71054.1} [Serendipita indica DSM 11827]CCA71054.1 hypothetical protein PIIN_04989 [Serendipita indica DSM 11827]
MSSILSQLVDAKKDTSLTRYVTCTALAVTTYDGILTLFDAIKLFRRSKTSLGRILYYLTRVVSFIGLTLMTYHISEFRLGFSRKACQIFVWIWPSLFSLTMLSTDWLLTLRISALYHSNALIWRGTYASLIICGLVTSGLLINIQVTYSKVIYYIDAVGICGVLTQGRDVVKTFYPWLAHETLLTVIMGVHTWRNFRKGSGRQTFPLLIVLYRDGALFYVVILAVRIWIIYTLSTLPLTRLYLDICVMWAACTLLTTRAYLNLCSIVLVREEEEAASMELQATIGFTSRSRASKALSPTRLANPTTIRPTEVYFRRETELTVDETRKNLSISPSPPLSKPSSPNGFDEERRLSGTTAHMSHQNMSPYR